MRLETGYTIGTLHFWAKTDNSKAYSQFIAQKYDPPISFELKDEIPWEEYKRTCFKFVKIKDVSMNKVVNLILKDLNKYICVITGTSRPYFIVTTFNYDELGIKYPVYTRQSKNGIIESFENHKYPFLIGNSKKPTPWIRLWIDWDARRSYKEEVFQSLNVPCPKNALNTFNGYHITRELAESRGTQDLSHFWKFIKTVWCSNNEELYYWVISWLAFQVQHPLIKMHSCLVLRGIEGIGKGIVIQLLKTIIGSEYFLQPSSPNDVLGTFNSLTANKALIFLDELVWGGDKEKSGVFKKLITESECTINEKHITNRKSTNCYNITIASNEDWVVPAGPNARRATVVDVNNTATTEEKDAVRLTCPFSLAKALYNWDLSHFDHRKIVTTTALANQKELSCSDTMKYVIDRVRNGTFPYNEKLLPGTCFAEFKSMFPHNKYTTVQSFCKDLKKIINYKKVQGTDGKRKLVFPNEIDCQQSINAYFQQDMFIDDKSDCDEVEVE